MPRSSVRSTERKKKVLVYLFGSLGDSIVAIPALRAVRRHFGDAEIVMLQNVSPGGIVAASQVIPERLVDRYISYRSGSQRLGQLLEFYGLWRRLRRERFDAAAYLIVSERTASDVRRDRLFFRACGVKKLFGFHVIPPADLYPVGPDGRAAIAEHESVFKLRRLARDGIEYSLEADLRPPLIETTDSQLSEIDKWLGERRRQPELPLVSIGPGCKQQVNEWPLENFARLGTRLMADFPCEIIVVGGKAEHEMAERLIAGWGSGINAAGRFSVQQSAALLSRCSVHIGLDTGTTHLAAAAGTRCFAIFGERNNQGTWYPAGPGHAIVHHPVACGPCRAFTCAVPGHPCMSGLSFEFVWKHLSEFIRSEDRGKETMQFAETGAPTTPLPPSI